MAHPEVFELPDDVAYFNTASLAPQLKAVRTAAETALDRRARPWAIGSADWFSDVERLRELFAAIVGADAGEIALVPATSYGFATAARNLPCGRVVVLAEEYPSGIYTWRAAGAELITVSREPGQSWAGAVEAAVDERVDVVSVPNVHWTDGSLVDLPRVAAAARAADAALVIDASQSAGVMPLDVAALKPDFLIAVGYKWLLGPLGLGYLYADPRHHDGAPIEQNWINRAGSEDFARLVDYRDEYQPGARRFDMGQRTSFVLTPMAIAALTQVLAWGVERIGAELAGVTERIAAGFGVSADRGPHILGIAPAPSAAALAAEGCIAAMRGDSLRISPHLHITEDDVARLRAALERA
ncbi:aminotransferase class V-fold PLP-dependent enzyme [Candidatus Solirubrobacter pratensis]|uniref:aminotransferase class V-fold PLP-dependent enzyme n=1 Tax=Candidatus Solirubrobacter pratensis TaxID=1298857 RepID=UPI0004158B6D|nr:aminotransferase class V-fold PLP-dependent enzyme [Candidatus Solirubrobacter pratensis]